MSIEGQGHFFTIYFPGFICFVLYKAKISGERLQDHWSFGCLNLQLTCLCLLGLQNNVCEFDTFNLVGSLQSFFQKLTSCFKTKLLLPVNIDSVFRTKL